MLEEAVQPPGPTSEKQLPQKMSQVLATEYTMHFLSCRLHRRNVSELILQLIWDNPVIITWLAGVTPSLRFVDAVFQAWSGWACMQRSFVATLAPMSGICRILRCDFFSGCLFQSWEVGWPLGASRGRASWCPFVMPASRTAKTTRQFLKG